MRFISLCLVCCSLWGSAVSAATMTSITQSNGTITSNGFFGGIINGNFKLLRSSTLDYPIYYTASSSLTVIYYGKAVAISQLPLRTPVQVTVSSGVVTGVRVMGVNE